ncbi:MAG TPA: glycosyltransferase family 9 protein, partial [Ilumatobacteraceae bacterium]|nr:glycosyltransferase family 9 protein [Ilumatobacteraceae bacterium]
MTTGPQHIAVVRLLRGLGDMLCLVPALRSLRASMPDAHVTLFGVQQGRWMVDRYPHLLDGFVRIDWWSGIPEADGKPRSTKLTLQRISRQRPYDIALQMHGTGPHINDLVEALHARSIAAHFARGSTAPSLLCRPWPERGHEIHRLLGLVEGLGCAPGGDRLEFPETGEDRVMAAPLLGRLASARYAVFHPGASTPMRQWSAAGFAEAARLVHQAGLDIVVTGSATERELAQRVRDLAGVPAFVAAGGTTRGALGALLRRASCVVANDTGVAHLAIATGAPTIVVHSTSDVERWGPLDRSRNAVVSVGRGPWSNAQIEATAVEVADT